MIQKILQKLGVVKNISQENKELQDFSGVKNLPKTSKRNITEFAKEENLNYNLAREVIVSDIVCEREEMDFGFLLETAKEHQSSPYGTSSPRDLLSRDEKKLFIDYCKYNEI